MNSQNPIFVLLISQSFLSYTFHVLIETEINETLARRKCKSYTNEELHTQLYVSKIKEEREKEQIC
jgi:hypothetical protein